MMGGPVAFVMASVLALAQFNPVPPYAGSRVQTVSYVPDQTVPLRVDLGFAAVVELAPDEAVDSVVVGNSAVWQVTPSRRGDRLVVKPLAGATTTNMIVVTDVRRYTFLLEPSGGQGEAPFILRFSYPQSTIVPLSGARAAGTYRFSGDKALFPIAMSDDGQRTTITWKTDIALPAIFATEGRSHEAIVNGRMIGGDYVVEGIASRYVFRLGNAKAVATRKSVGPPR